MGMLGRSLTVQLGELCYRLLMLSDNILSPVIGGKKSQGVNQYIPIGVYLLIIE